MKVQHKWDYGLSEPRQSTGRSCVLCWARGSRARPGVRWSTRMPDGAFSMLRIPVCPGTPWVREMTPDGLQYCLYDTSLNHARIARLQARGVLLFGRKGLWEFTPNYSFLPPPPEAAWQELEHHWSYLRPTESWVIRTEAGAQVPVTDAEIRDLGAHRTREYVAGLGLPPLPEAAWHVLHPSRPRPS